MEIALKTCPFCNGRPVVIAQQLNGKKVLRVECSACKVATVNMAYSGRSGVRSYDQQNRIEDLTYCVGLEEAREYLVHRWNRRADDAAPADAAPAQACEAQLL